MVSIMKRSKLFLILTALITFSCVSKNVDAANNNILDHAILVNVNGKKITRSQLDTMGLILFKMNYPNRDENSINEAELEALSAGAMKELIITFLTEDEYKKIMEDDEPSNDFDITTVQVERELKTMGIGRLKNKPLAERYARSKIMRRNIVYATRSNMDASPREVKKFYLKHKKTVFTGQRMIRIRELFLSSDKSNAELSKKQAYMLYDNLKKNSIAKRISLFPEMAKEFSRDKFAKNGGLIVTGTPGNFFPQEHDFVKPDGTTFFPKEMIQAIHDLNAKGDIIITKSARGWHILLLEEIKGGKKIPFAKAKKIIEGYLGDSKYEKAYIDWLKSKVKKNIITWNDGDPFTPEKITSVASKEESLRFLRTQMQIFIQQENESKKRR